MTHPTRAALCLSLVLALCAPAIAQQATAATLARRRLPDWVDAILRQLDTHNLKWESVSIAVPDDPDAKKDTARVEIHSSERFWRLSHMLVFTPGPSDMKYVATGSQRRAQVLYPVAIEQPTIREGDLSKLADARQDVAKLVEHLLAPGVAIEQLLASRPAAQTLFDQAVLRVPVRFTLSGARADVLARLAQLAAALPRSYLKSLRAANAGRQLTVAVSINLLVKRSDPPATGGADALRAASETLAGAGGPGVKVTSSTPADSATAILALKGTVADAAAAHALVNTAMGLPGLKAYDELGWRRADGKTEITGLLHF